jgi:hypothetical protein
VVDALLGMSSVDPLWTSLVLEWTVSAGGEMGSNVVIYGSEADCRSLEKFTQSLGLHLIAPVVGAKAPESGKDGPWCYLSLRPESELRPFGTPPRYTDARDPLLGFMRPYYAEPYLVLGHIHRSTDVRDLATLTELPFNRIRRWIKDGWTKYEDIYIGPGAIDLIEKGAQKVNVLPGSANFTIVRY